MTSKIVVIGGGIAGLTTATLLNAAGLQLTILEASPSLGGLAKSTRTSEGFPAEHSLRVYHEVYHCLFDLYKKIPFNEKESLFDQLTPISLALLYEHDAYLYQPKTKKNVFTNLYEQFKLSLFLRRQGFTLSDFIRLMREDLFDRQCQERLMYDLGDKSIGEYLKNASPAYLSIIFANHQMSFAATKNTAAPLAIQMDTEGRPFSFFAMANGPTSERIFDPWENYLKNNGVEIRKETVVTEFTLNNDRISAVKLASGETIPADIFICAASEMDFPRLIKSAITENKNHKFKNITFTGEWSNGIQFYLSDLPKTDGVVNKFNQPGVLCANLSTPWKIVSVVQGKDFWKNVSFPAGCQYCLSMTITDARTPGILFQKPFVECTKDEIKAELLHQLALPINDLIVDWNLDDALVFMRDEEYQKKKETLAIHQAHKRKDGDWILNFMTLYTPTPNDMKNEPSSRTDISNLYLAGAYCKTAMILPTMEKACESGYLAAQAISEDLKLPNKIALPFKSYNTKIFYVWRAIDLIIFKAQCWLKNTFGKDKTK